ncbi:hypothetical protein POM88_036229 [Heracleum sosnowskyi]|uniref:SEC63 domain-containing protein n=1 Tax=Heracleum sosnowskyi TaxID=360622 RepID=A0AAD8HPT2_9APIA|nr:hypothetical protein POM88_036229 [Heracleum sosnowskyi]
MWCHFLHHEYFLLKKQYIDEDRTLSFTFPIYEPLPPQYLIHVVSDKWIGSQTVLPVSCRHLILPEKYPPPTELLDLQPLPINALRNPSNESPDKWDAPSCRWKQRKHVKEVGRFIVDELHLIWGQGGPILEVIVSRMRNIASQIDTKIKIVALSTSLANAKDLGEWISAISHGLFNFPPGVRPLPLEIHIQGVSIASSEARMQAMTKPTYTAIIEHAKNGKPAVLFVPTRKHSWLTAVDLMTYSSREGGENPMFVLQSSAELEPFVDRIRESMLRERLQYYGVGYLQEGLSPTDQDIVRTLFETGWIQVCVMTSSMCSGMPLCAHLVIIMGRQYYDGRENAHRDYQVSVILQKPDKIIFFK